MDRKDCFSIHRFETTSEKHCLWNIFPYRNKETGSSVSNRFNENLVSRMSVSKQRLQKLSFLFLCFKLANQEDCFLVHFWNLKNRTEPLVSGSNLGLMTISRVQNSRTKPPSKLSTSAE